MAWISDVMAFFQHALKAEKTRPAHIIEVLEETGKPLSGSEISYALLVKSNATRWWHGQSPGWLYVTLRRLEEKGHIKSGKFTPESQTEIDRYGPAGKVVKYFIPPPGTAPVI